jgi:hypothetical protein
MFEKFKPKVAPTMVNRIDNIDRIIGQIGNLSNQLSLDANKYRLQLN